MPEVIFVRDILSFTSGSPHFQLWDILPWTHAVNAMRAILLFDQSLADVAGDLILLTIMGGIWMLLGMFMFIRKRFQIERGD